MSLIKDGLKLFISFTGSGLNDGQWHTVHLIGRRGRLAITVDGDDGGTAQANPTFSVSPENQLFFGGEWMEPDPYAQLHKLI